MIRIIFIFGIFIFSPVLVFASTASDFIVNPQSTYDVPPGTTQLLILDLTLPNSGLESIKIVNLGTIQQYDIYQISIYEDGSSPGWDGDESERARKTASPFWDTELTGAFSKQRIFVTVNVTSTVASGRTIKPQLEINSVVFSNPAFNGPTDKKIIGLERFIVVGADMPSVPVSPLVRKGEAISTSTIRWYFTDLSNNESGFKILDKNLNTVATGGANISYLDEIGLEPNTEYSGRQVKVFNDMGQSSASTLTVFPAVTTLALPAVAVPPPEEPAEEAVEETAQEGTGGPLSAEELRALIQEIQQKIIDLLNQLINLLQQQISQAQASLFGAFDALTNWLEARFR